MAGAFPAWIDLDVGRKMGALALAMCFGSLGTAKAQMAPPVFGATREMPTLAERFPEKFQFERTVGKEALAGYECKLFDAAFFKENRLMEIVLTISNADHLALIAVPFRFDPDDNAFVFSFAVHTSLEDFVVVNLGNHQVIRLVFEPFRLPKGFTTRSAPDA